MLLSTTHAAPAASAPAQTPKTRKMSKTPKGTSSLLSVMTPLLSLPPDTPMPTPTPKSEHEVQMWLHHAQASLLLSAQVKALGFVAYLLHGGMAAKGAPPSEDELAACLLQLLKNW